MSPIVLSALAFLGIALAFIGLMMPRRSGQVGIQGRLNQYAVRDAPIESLEETELSRPRAPDTPGHKQEAPVPNFQFNRATETFQRDAEVVAPHRELGEGKKKPRLNQK